MNAPDRFWNLPIIPDLISFHGAENFLERFLARCVSLCATMRWRATVPARQIRMTSREVSADVRLCLTVTCLYTIVGLGLVVAFM